MSKRRILRGMVYLLTITLIVFLYNGVVTLIEENKELKQENHNLYKATDLFMKEIKRVKLELQKSANRIEDIKLQLDDSNKKVNDLDKELKKYKEDNDRLKKELSLRETREKYISPLNDSRSTLVSRGEESAYRVLYMEASAYIPTCSEGCTGITATGINLLENPSAKVIAVDPNIIPLGTKVFVEGYGYAIAGDTGGAIKGYKIDLNMPTTQQALEWGRRNVKVTILE